MGTAYIDHVTKQPTEDVALEQVEAIYEVVGLMSYYFRTSNYKPPPHPTKLNNRD